MSAYKKRDPPPLSPLQQHTQSIQQQFPATQPLFFLVQQRSDAIRLARFQAEWTTQKQAAVAHMQQLCNGWIRHTSSMSVQHQQQASTSSQLTVNGRDDGATNDTAASSSFDESTVSSSSSAASIHSRQLTSHWKALRSAESSLQQMQLCLEKMRSSYATLDAHITFLRDTWCELYNATSDAENPEYLQREPIESDSISISSRSPLPQFLPTDCALTPNSQLTIQQALTHFSTFAQHYRADLHTKHLLVSALDAMIHSTPIDENDTAELNHALTSAAASSTSQQLLQHPDIAAAIEKRRLATDATPLSLYVAAFNLEPQPSDVLLQIVSVVDAREKASGINSKR